MHYAHSYHRRLSDFNFHVIIPTPKRQTDVRPLLYQVFIRVPGTGTGTGTGAPRYLDSVPKYGIVPGTVLVLVNSPEKYKRYRFVRARRSNYIRKLDTFLESSKGVIKIRCTVTSVKFGSHALVTIVLSGKYKIASSFGCRYLYSQHPALNCYYVIAPRRRFECAR